MWVELEIEETSIFEKLLFYAKQLKQQKEPTKTTTILVDERPSPLNSPGLRQVFRQFLADFYANPRAVAFYSPATFGLVLLPIKNANFQNIFAKKPTKISEGVWARQHDYNFLFAH